MPNNELSKEDRRWLLDPYAEASLAMHHGADAGATLGLPIPLVGPAVGGLAGGAYGLYKAMQRHAQAKDAYKRHGGRLSWAAEHPFAAGAIPTIAGIIPGTAPAGLAIGDALARHVAPKDLAPVETSDDEKLDHPYDYLGRQTNTGALIGMGIGGSGAVMGGRYLGKRFSNYLDAGATVGLGAVKGFGKALARLTPLSSGRLHDALHSHTPVRIPRKAWSIAGGLALGGLGAAAGGVLGSVPKIISTVGDHERTVARARQRGERLDGTVASPYLPYLVGRSLGAPLGLSGASSLGLEGWVEYKRQQQRENKPPAGAGDFVSFMEKKYAQPIQAVQKFAAADPTMQEPDRMSYAPVMLGTGVLGAAVGATLGMPLGFKARVAERSADASLRGAAALGKFVGAGLPRSVDEAVKHIDKLKDYPKLQAQLRRAAQLRYLKHAPHIGGLSGAALGAALAAGGVAFYNSDSQAQGAR